MTPMQSLRQECDSLKKENQTLSVQLEDSRSLGAGLARTAKEQADQIARLAQTDADLRGSLAHHEEVIARLTKRLDEAHDINDDVGRERCAAETALARQRLVVQSLLGALHAACPPPEEISLTTSDGKTQRVIPTRPV